MDNRLAIGLFGLIGMLGVMTAPLVGRFVDKLNGWTTTLIAIMVGIAFQAIYTGAAGLNIGAVVVACFGESLIRSGDQVLNGAFVQRNSGIDVAGQMNQVSNSSRIYAFVHPPSRPIVCALTFPLSVRIEPLARARMNAVFIISVSGLTQVFDI